MGILKLRRCEGRRDPPPLPAALPPLPLQARDPEPDTDPLSPDEVDIADDIYYNTRQIEVFIIGTEEATLAILK